VGDHVAGRDPGSGVPLRSWRDDLRLLRERNLGLLVASRLVSDVGTGVAPIALAFGVLGLPGGDAQGLGSPPGRLSSSRPGCSSPAGRRSLRWPRWPS
jgi:hypothetical protein